MCRPGGLQNKKRKKKENEKRDKYEYLARELKNNNNET